MSRLDTETTRKLREMNADDLLAAIDMQDETLSMGLPFGERVRLIVERSLVVVVGAATEPRRPFFV